MTDLIDIDKANQCIFNPSRSQPDLYAAWQHFICCGDIQRHIVADDIAESWRRSRALSIVPDRISNTAYADPEQYQLQVHQYGWIPELARPILNNLFGHLGKARHIVSYYSPHGYAIVRLGQRADIHLYERHGLNPELCFDESLVGTAGFNLARHLRRCVRIVRAEHYLKPLHPLSGFYTPILDQSKTVLGVIAVENLFDQVCPQIYSVLISAAFAIESLIAIDQLKTENHAYRHSLKIATDPLDNGIILMDGDGHIREMNLTACQILHYQPKTSPLERKAKMADIKPFGENLIKALQSARSDFNPVYFNIDGKTYQVQSSHLQRQDSDTAYTLVQLQNTHRPNSTLTSEQRLQPVYTLNSIIGSSAVMDQIKELVSTAAATEAPVIIEGESGTGKELVAQSIHNASKRKNAPFIAINCAAIPAELIESIIFGHKKGAFTGAFRNHIGKFESAHNGTLFLDEIADMSLTMQAKILRAIEEGVIERIGDDRPIAVNVRIIAASNKNLLDLIRLNRFRQDLFYRLNVFRITLPALRERIEDTDDLVRFFISELAPEYGKSSIEASTDYLRCLQSYQWPGNIRELRNAVQYSIARLNGRKLNSEHLVGFFTQGRDHQPQESEATDDDLVLSRQEARIITDALQRHRGNKTTTAKALGISRATLYRKLKAIRSSSSMYRFKTT
jgi:sigma-54 dependent transcriptional regulator, acetoin dehydrogenase operon transcriptional activator AcoR